MHIVLAASEAVPFAKTGGLADVCGALPKHLAARGHRCSLFLPGYRRAIHSGHPMEDTHVSFVVDMAGKQVAARILKTTMHEGAADVYFVDQPHYFDREQLYGDEHGDYRDNAERFSFFCRTVVEAIERLQLHVDVLHAHDWQTGLLPAYVRTGFGGKRWYQHAATVMTIHNLAYQGRFWSHDMNLTGMDWQYFNWQQMEFFGDLNLLKTGISFADFITTVSPSYAQEIQTPEHGCGLDGVLRSKQSRLLGIVNGVDYNVWDPRHDTNIAQNYGAENWRDGKAVCKSDLQRMMGLPVDHSRPVIGLIGRLAEQKGWDLVKPLMESSLEQMPAQWVILGNGEQRFANALSQLAARYPDKVAVRLEFSEPLAHKIEAGSDMFLMPSRYEPCGLNQLYSLRYGTVPLVHATGGLNDTVTDLNQESDSADRATGFAFRDYSLHGITECVWRALNIYSQDCNQWGRLVSRGMQQDWSWSASASFYESVYSRAREQAAIEGRL
ncbi:glycogen synthase GlgA [Pirellulaceae bacterium SH501]